MTKLREQTLSAPTPVKYVTVTNIHHFTCKSGKTSMLQRSNYVGKHSTTAFSFCPLSFKDRSGVRMTDGYLLLKVWLETNVCLTLQNCQDKLYNNLFLASLISLFIVGSSVLPWDSPTGDVITTVWGSEPDVDAVRIWYVCSSPPAPEGNAIHNCTTITSWLQAR